MPDVIKPVVKLFLLCDEASLDPNDEKWTIKNPWHTVAMPPGIIGNFCQEEIWAYVQYSEGAGDFYLSIEIRDEAGMVIGRSQPSYRELAGGYEVYEEVFHLTDVPFDEPGVYEFKVMGNHAELDGGTIYLRVLPGA